MCSWTSIPSLFGRGAGNCAPSLDKTRRHSWGALVCWLTDAFSGQCQTTCCIAYKLQNAQPKFNFKMKPRINSQWWSKEYALRSSRNLVHVFQVFRHVRCVTGYACPAHAAAQTAGNKHGTFFFSSRDRDHMNQIAPTNLHAEHTFLDQLRRTRWIQQDRNDELELVEARCVAGLLKGN